MEKNQTNPVFPARKLCVEVGPFWHLTKDRHSLKARIEKWSYSVTRSTHYELKSRKKMSNHNQRQKAMFFERKKIFNFLQKSLDFSRFF